MNSIGQVAVQEITGQISFRAPLAVIVSWNLIIAKPQVLLGYIPNLLMQNAQEDVQLGCAVA